MSDIFKRKIIDPKKPITADMVQIEWDGLLAQAMQISLQYNQPVTRRYTLGTNGKNTVVIFPGRPIGTLSISRLIIDQGDNVFERKGWDPCGDLATIYINLDGSSTFENCTANGGTYVIRGALANSYGMQAEAEGLSIVDNINVEFMQLEYTPPSA